LSDSVNSPGQLASKDSFPCSITSNEGTGTINNLMHKMVADAAEKSGLSITKFVNQLGIKSPNFTRNIVNAGAKKVTVDGIPQLSKYFKLTPIEVLNFIHTPVSAAPATAALLPIIEKHTFTKTYVVGCILVILFVSIACVAFLQIQFNAKKDVAGTEAITYDKNTGYHFVDANDVQVQKYSGGQGSDIDLSQFTPANQADTFLAGLYQTRFNTVTLYRKFDLVIISGSYYFYPKNTPSDARLAVLQGFGTLSGDWAAISYISRATENESVIEWTGSAMLNIINSEPASGYYTELSGADNPFTEHVELGSGFVLGNFLWQY
jgi:hypothetical protein